MRALKWTAGILLILIVVIALFLAFGLQTLKGPISRAATKATGRELKIEGQLRPIWLHGHPGIRADKVSFANAQWAKQPAMFQADAVEASIELSPLLIGRVVLPEVHLARPVVDLEVNDRGDKNWLLAQQEKQEGGSRIAIRALTFDNADLRYSDVQRAIDLDVALSTDRDNVTFNAKGKYAGLPATAEGRGGQVLKLKDASAPYPIDATVKIGDTQAKLNGTLTNVAELSALDLAVELRGKTMSELYHVVGVALPETSAYATHGRLVKGDNMVRYENFAGTVGTSDIAGTLQVDLGRKRPFMHGELRSKVIDLADLGSLIGTKEQPENAGVLPDMPFDADRWDSVDADVTISAGSIRRPKQLPLEHLATRIQMHDKLLTLQPFDFGIAGGTIGGTIKLDGRQSPIAGDVNLRINDLSLAKLMPTIKENQGSIGDINGLIEIAGRGDSVADLLGSANGKVGVIMDGGKISRFMMELVALNLWGAAKVKLKGDEPVDIRCGVADFGMKNGLMHTNAFVFDTQVVDVKGEGDVNLKNEAMDLKLDPHPKEKSLASLNSPLYIRGTFGAPKVAPDWKKVGGKGIGALALGVINPLLAILPLAHKGKGQDSPCAQLIAEASKPAKANAATGGGHPAK